MSDSHVERESEFDIEELMLRTPQGVKYRWPKREVLTGSLLYEHQRVDGRRIVTVSQISSKGSVTPKIVRAITKHPS